MSGEIDKESFRKGKIAGARSFAKLVKQMRDAQKRYFATKSKESLNESFQLEKKVDEAVKLILNEK